MIQLFDVQICLLFFNQRVCGVSCVSVSLLTDRSHALVFQCFRISVFQIFSVSVLNYFRVSVFNLSPSVREMSVEILV
jgi:hypothetical protein